MQRKGIFICNVFFTNFFMETLEKYPNAIYTYGHTHWRTEEESAWYNSSELIWNYGSRIQNADGSYTTDGYHYIHASSISNTATRLDSNTTPGESTNVSQILMVDFYEDHITFEFVNVGAMENVEGVRTITTYTIKRDMSQLDVYSGKQTSSETSGYETMSSPGVTTEKQVTTRPNRPTNPGTIIEPDKKEEEDKINPLAIIIPVAVILVGGGATAFIFFKKKKKKS